MTHETRLLYLVLSLQMSHVTYESVVSLSVVSFMSHVTCQQMSHVTHESVMSLISSLMLKLSIRITSNNADEYTHIKSCARTRTHKLTHAHSHSHTHVHAHAHTCIHFHIRMHKCIRIQDKLMEACCCSVVQSVV